MSKIHPTALVDPKAEIANDVEIGAYSIIGPDVKIDSGTQISAHVVIQGHTTIGKNNQIFQFNSLGAIPQDKKYKQEPTQLIIGDNNTIREFCTFNLGTVQDKGITNIGDNNWIMAYVHIAHDCNVGNNVIMANNSSLAGHVDVHDYAITAVGSVIFKDIPPYITASGYDANPHGINAEGLKRRNFSPEQILNIKRAYKALYRNGLSLEEAKSELISMSRDCPEVSIMADFLNHSTRGIIR